MEGVATVSGLKELPFPSTTSLSIVTPAKASIPHDDIICTLFTDKQVTLNILKEAKELNVLALWLQPGAEDESVIAFIKESGLADHVIYGGPCLLVEGEGIRKSLL